MARAAKSSSQQRRTECRSSQRRSLLLHYGFHLELLLIMFNNVCFRHALQVLQSLAGSDSDRGSITGYVKNWGAAGGQCLCCPATHPGLTLVAAVMR